ncbi:MAG TPA: hypothetical protein VHE37_05340 [Nevskiaceae bacterium]|nr:hypothetical protein [Nevskiaceae bacterium]
MGKSTMAMAAVAAWALACSTQASMARPQGLSAPLAQALANVQAQQRERMRSDFRTGWAELHRQLAEQQVAQRAPAATESEAVKSAP